MSNINNVNANLKEKIDEFPAEIRNIAMEIIESFSQKNKSIQSIEDMIERRINNLLNEGK